MRLPLPNVRSPLVLVAAALAGCSGPAGDSDAPAGDPLVAGAPLAGAAEGTIDLPLGTPMGGFSSRCGYLGGTGKQDDRQSPYTTAFVETTGMITRPGMDALWLENGDEVFVLVKLDLIYSYDGLVEEVTRRLEEATGRALDGRVAIATNHSHQSYGPFTDATHFYLGGDRYNEEIFQRLATQVTDLVMTAHDTRREAAIGVGWAYDWDPDDLVYRDRRGENDSLRVWDDLPAGGHGKDPYLTMLRVDDLDGAPIAVVFGFGIHGTVLSEDNSMITGEAAQFVEHGVEEAFAEPVVVMHLQTAGGDASPAGTDDGIARLESLGEYARDRVYALWEATPTGTDGLVLETASRHVPQLRPYVPDRVVAGVDNNEATMRVTRGGAVDWRYRHYEEGYVADDVIYADDGTLLSPFDEFNARYGAAFCGSDAPLIPAGNIGSEVFPYSACMDVELMATIIDSIFKMSAEGWSDGLPLPMPESLKAGTTMSRWSDVATLMPDGTIEARPFHLAFVPAEPTYMYVEQFRRRAEAEIGWELPFVVGYAQDHEGYFLIPEDWMLGGYEPNINLWGPLQAESVMEDMLAYGGELLSTTDVREDPDPTGTYAPTTYADRDLPTGFLPDLTPDAGALVTTPPAYLWVPSGFDPAALTVPAQVERVAGVVTFAWRGGDAMVDLPRVVLERLGDDGATWSEVTTPSGRPVDDRYSDILVAWTPDPLYPVTGEQTHTYWAAWQAVGHVADRTSLPTGTYRLRVHGQAWAGGDATWPWTTTPYEVVTPAFEVVPAPVTITVDDTGVYAALVAPAHGWRLVDLGGSSHGNNPVRGELSVAIERESGLETYTVSGEDVVTDPADAHYGSSRLPIELPDDTISVTVTDAWGNTGTVTFGA